ncbi:ABC transporter permease [Virgibacillus sp. MSP4-1]|uniref:ABC transporter permease n=1 Tax=Virgibacillus sp. MSP4-1 TaxID=2700081 RepID=UPI0003A5B3C9|nr:ABC transporter permease [Virgibacillus sp. MSP4-1]QHS23526.1 ABC transporter permease [Virgibacillus sp. MSP4-1]
MKSALVVLKEQFKFFYLIRRLSLYELKSNNAKNYLGMAWEVINPAIQIVIFWFVFGVGMRDRGTIEGMPFFHWLLAGIVVWFFVNQGILKGTKSIFSKIKILSKMNFPMSIIPNYIIVAQLYPHVFLLFIAMVILNFLGYPISEYYLQIPYFMFGVLALLFSFSLITSTLATIIPDVHAFIQSTMRMLLYLSPILWSPERLPGNLETIVKLNPFYYIIEGYRHSLLGMDWYLIVNWEYTLYFWLIVIFFFVAGSYLHVKFRRHFIDFI